MQQPEEQSGNFLARRIKFAIERRPEHADGENREKAAQAQQDDGKSLRPEVAQEQLLTGQIGFQRHPEGRVV